uniref:Uncharacterized protein n=1 Tax=Micrurus surinamensis TaxID=129470 RepID=A0A2D4NP54_MICSU
MEELFVEMRLYQQDMKEMMKVSLEMCSNILQKLEMAIQIEEEQREPEVKELNKEETSFEDQVEQQLFKQGEKRFKVKNLRFDVKMKGGMVRKAKQRTGKKQKRELQKTVERVRGIK